MESERPVERVSRRRFLARMTAGIAAGPLIGSAVAGCAQSIGGGRSAPLAQGRSGLNILFVFTDQERYFGQWPAGFTLPGHERLQDGTPWALVVSLVNPHDVMYFNTDAPGERVQNPGYLLMRTTRAPNQPFYEKSWDVP